MRWHVEKHRHPTDPARAWIAYPGRSRSYGQRFPTWRQAWDHAAARAYGKATP